MRLRNSEVRELQNKISEIYGDIFDKKAVIEKSEVNGKTVYSANNEPILVETDKIFPTVKLLLKNMVLPKVVVDMGAVKFVASGADVMRPGITDIPEIEKGQIVAVVDEKYGKPLAVAETLYSSSEMREMAKGKVLASLHYVGDDIWQFQS